MALILGIVDVPRRCMGDDDVKTLQAPDFGANPANLFAHLTFGVLMRLAVVPVGSFQAQNSQTPVYFDFAVQIRATVWSVTIMPDDVVSADIVQRNIEA